MLNNDFAEKGEPRVILFCAKIVSFRPHAKQTNATQARHRRRPGARVPSSWAIFVILQQKMAILTPFESYFALFEDI